VAALAGEADAGDPAAEDLAPGDCGSEAPDWEPPDSEDSGPGDPAEVEPVASSRLRRLRTFSSAAIGLESRLLIRVVLNSWPALALASLSGSLRSLSKANTRSSGSLAGHSTSAVSRSLTLLRRSAITSLRKRRTYRSLMSSLLYRLGSAIAVGSSMFIRLAKLSGLPSCGVADSRIKVSDRVASRARWLFWAPRARSATFWHSSITMMSQLALSR